MAPLVALIPMAFGAVSAALPSLATIGTAATVAGTGLAVAGSLAAADAQKNASITSQSIAQVNAQNQAAALKVAATEDQQRAASEMATSQLQAQQQKRQENALISKQQAMYGASGGGSGGGAETVEANTQGQGDYDSELELWQGQNRDNQYSDAAATKNYNASQVLFGNQISSEAMQSSRDTASALLPLQIGSQIISGVSNVAKFSSPSYSGDTLIGSNYDPASGWQTNTYKSGLRYG